MKLSMFFLCLTMLFIETGNAQSNDDGRFKKENIFWGGSLNIGLSTGVFQIGANPEIGYTVTNFLDAGVLTNLIYGSINPDYNEGVKQSSFNYGAGLFTRVYPLDFLFVQAQAEHNWVSYRLKDEATEAIFKNTLQSNSILAGIGYGRRSVGQGGSYIVLLFDLSKNLNSPYIDVYGNSVPIIRGGFTTYLKSKKERKK